jgi:hypothetical protein
MAEKNWLQQEWQDTKDFANIGASGIMKAAEWALAGGMHGGKKGMPIAPIDEWEGELTKPSTWDLDPGDQYGPIDFWKSWKPDLADIPGELAHFARPFWKGAPEWGEEWKKKHDFYLTGSTGDQFGLAGVGNFEKNPAYSELQQNLISGTGPDNYMKLIPNPLYHNMTKEDFYGLKNIDLGSHANYLQSSSYIPEETFDQLVGEGILSDGTKKEGFFIDKDIFGQKRMVQDASGERFELDGYNAFLRSTDDIFRQFLSTDGSIDLELMDKYRNNPLLMSTWARMNIQDWGGDLNSVVMMEEDKATNFSHEALNGVSMFFNQAPLGSNAEGMWQLEDETLNPMIQTTGPMMDESLPVVGKMLEGQEGIVGQAKDMINEATGWEIEKGPGSTFMDLMMEQYPFGDPQVVKDIKSDIMNRGAAGGMDPDGPTGLENLALHAPEALALIMGPKVKGPKGKGMMESIMGGATKASLSPFNVFTPFKVVPYSKKSPRGIYQEATELPSLEGVGKDLGPLEYAR